MKTQSVVSTLSKEQGQGEKVKIGLHVNLACVGMALCVFVGCDYTGGNYPKSHYTFRQKGDWLNIYQDGHWIGAARNPTNKWTVTGAEVGRALKERDQILWKQQLDAGLIDKDEYRWLLDHQK